MKYLLLILTICTLALAQPPEVTVLRPTADTFTANNAFAGRSLHQLAYLTVADYLAGATRWQQTTYLMFRIPEGDWHDIGVLNLTVQANDNLSAEEAVIMVATAEPFTEAQVTHNSPPVVLETVSFFGVESAAVGSVLRVDIPLPDEPGLYAIALRATEGLGRVDFVSSQGATGPVLELRPPEPDTTPQADDVAEISFPTAHLLDLLNQQHVAFWFGDTEVTVREIDGESRVTLRGNARELSMLIAWLRITLPNGAE